jgi:rhomboid protease GluP
LAHLVFNMVALYQTGRMTERMFGSTRFLMLYVVAGLSGSVASLLWNPLVNSAGASGAIFGVFGGLLAFALNSNNGIPLSVMNQHRNSTLAFIVFNLYIGLRSSGIDNAAHFGGLIGGLAMGLLLARPVEVETRTEPNFRRLGMVSIFALVALGLISYPLRNPSGNTRQEFVFVQTLDTFAVKEKKALADIQKLQTVKSTMAPAELARMLEQDIAPQWDELYRMIASAELSVGSKRYAMREALLGYLDNRRKSMHLMAEGVRLNNLFILAKAQDASLKAAQQLEEVRKLGAH